jgi:HlyD family secretion protein
MVVAAYFPLARWWHQRNLPKWRTEALVRGDLAFVVNSTGTIEPVMSVQIGSFVSGPIDPDTPLVEFNEEVEKGDVLARIDPRIYEADVARDTAAVQAAQANQEAARAGVDAARASVEAAKATLSTRLAEVQRAKAQLMQAENDETRAQELAAENADFISQSEMDQLIYNRLQLQEQVNVAAAAVDQARAAVSQSEAAVVESEASLARAQASVAQAKANMMRSELNRDYTVITSPVDGIVIDRRIEPGQTLAASFQTPELYVIAPNMREEMYVYASVDEADIGFIRSAKDRNNKVEFTVDAYPDDVFDATIKEVRFSSTTTQNVVTYPVVVSAPNPDLKLLPGMTASISFLIEEKQDVLKIPNAALRYYPPKEHVREEDRKLLEGASLADDDEQNSDQAALSVAQKAEAARRRNRRHVWVAEGELLRAVEVVVGITDGEFTELTSGDLTEGAELVTGIDEKK